MGQGGGRGCKIDFLLTCTLLLESGGTVQSCMHRHASKHSPLFTIAISFLYSGNAPTEEKPFRTLAGYIIGGGEGWGGEDMQET